MAANAPQDEAAQSGNAPVLTSKEGTINAACWTKNVTTKKGETVIVYNVSIDRSYKQGSEWKHSQALHVTGERDLHNLSAVVTEMLGQIQRHKQDHGSK